MAGSSGAHVPGEEDDVEPEFQVAPMVDVLLVLLLFFMATATTDIVAQVADLVLPKANDASEKDKEAKQITINVEKLGQKIQIMGQYYNTPKELEPRIKAEMAQAIADGTPVEKFRVLVRSDENSPFGIVSDVLQASSDAGCPNVTFSVNFNKKK